MPQPDLPVVLTASVAQGSAPSAAALAAYFQSPGGIASLRSRGPVDNIQMEAADSTFFVFTSGTDGDHLRGIISLHGGMIVMIALQPTGATELSEKAKFATLDAFARIIAKANPASILMTRGI